MPDFPIVDTHLHTHLSSSIGIQAMGGQPLVPGQTGVIEELLPNMARLGVTYGVMVNFTPVADMWDAAVAGIRQDVSETERRDALEEVRQTMLGRIRRRNEWTCSVAREHPNLLAYVGIDPIMTEREMVAELERSRAEGASGIKLHTHVQRFALDDQRLWPAYRTAQRLGLGIVAHTGPFQGDDRPETRPSRAAGALQAFPGLTLVVAHAGGARYHPEAVELARQFPQVAFDCCALVPGSPGPEDLSDEQLVDLFRALGTERVVYGSDWPWRDPQPEIERLMRLPLTESEHARILGGNAMRIFSLG